MQADVSMVDQIFSPDGLRITDSQRLVLQWALHVDRTPKTNDFHASAHHETTFPKHFDCGTNMMLNRIRHPIWRQMIILMYAGGEGFRPGSSNFDCRRRLNPSDTLIWKQLRPYELIYLFVVNSSHLTCLILMIRVPSLYSGRSLEKAKAESFEELGWCLITLKCSGIDEVRHHRINM